MHRDAVEKAQRKLVRAEMALNGLKQSTTAEAVENAWEDFLMACGSIYAALYEGSKLNGRSAAWYGAEKNRRKKDPLLRYLHFARNVEEHGLQKIVERGSTSVAMKSPGASVRLRSNGKQWVVVGTIGVVEFADDVVCLATVTDTRFNDSAAPPTSHMGEEIKDPTPLAVAKVGYRYLQQMVSRAEALHDAIE